MVAIEREHEEGRDGNGNECGKMAHYLIDYKVTFEVLAAKAAKLCSFTFPCHSARATTLPLGQRHVPPLTLLLSSWNLPFW